MTRFTVQEPLTAEDMEFYSKSYKGLVPTGETIKEEYDDGSITRVVFKGSWTPSGAMRDCGDHYIIARYSRYDRVSKDLQTITEDVNDR